MPHQRELDLLPYNHWPGLSVPAELLAVFIQPNEPSLMTLQRAVADILQEFSESPSLEGYQAANPARSEDALRCLRRYPATGHHLHQSTGEF